MNTPLLMFFFVFALVSRWHLVPQVSVSCDLSSGRSPCQPLSTIRPGNFLHHHLLHRNILAFLFRSAGSSFPCSHKSIKPCPRGRWVVVVSWAMRTLSLPPPHHPLHSPTIPTRQESFRHPRAAFLSAHRRPLHSSRRLKPRI